MELKKSSNVLNIIVAGTFLLMILLNVLANLLPLNGITTAQVSDSYPNLFAPAGITFAIWGVIYLLLAVYVAYQLGWIKSKAERYQPLLDKTGILFSVSSIANAAWIICWHYNFITASVALMVVILGCLIGVSLILHKSELTQTEKLTVRLPFSVYFGWITIASIANITTLLVSMNWNGFGIPKQIWTVTVLAVGVAIGVIAIVRDRDFAYGVVLIWAYIGIFIKHTSVTGFASAYPVVIFAAVAGIVLFVLAEGYLLFCIKKKKPEAQQAV